MEKYIYKEWIRIAKRDLDAGKFLKEEDLLENSLFHIGESIEKALKAYLIEVKKDYQEVNYKKEDEINGLIKECAALDDAFERYSAKAEEFNKLRKFVYPTEGLNWPGKDKIDDYIKEAEEIIALIEEKIG